MKRTRRTAPARPAERRVSPTAPASASIGEQQWAKALADPATEKALRDGLADADAGRVSPWGDVRRRLGL